MTSEHGLSEKVALEGMSRGGLIIYNWAKKNPEKTLCIYGDAPVLDFKSWPGGKGKGKGSKGTWEKCLQVYGLTEIEAKTFRGLPLYGLESLAKQKVPLFHVVGQADTIVPVEENTDLLEKSYKALGGSIKVIRKEGVGHHPHSLKDPGTHCLLRPWRMEKPRREKVSNRCILNRPDPSDTIGPYGRSHSIRRAEPRPSPGGRIGRL